MRRLPMLIFCSLAAVVTCSDDTTTTPKGTGGSGGNGGAPDGGGGTSVTTSGGGTSETGGGGSGGDGAGSPFDCRAPVGVPGALQLVEVANLTDSPLLLTAPTGDEDTAYVVSKLGAIRTIELATGDLTDFVDLGDRVSTTANEQGLLGLAFHPDYATNGRYFVHYSDLNGDTAIHELSRDDPSVDIAVLDELHPASNHYGGALMFGPDGQLYASIGDGNQNFQGQDPTTIFGAIVRIDVDGDLTHEVLHYGLRNPWRSSFDPCTGDLYVGDVGETMREEVNVAPAGSGPLNWGWDCFEGSEPFVLAPMTCPTGNEVPPVVEYETGVEGCAVTGGYVYRGSAIGWLRGRYLYGDLCLRRVWSFIYAGGVAVDLVEHTDDLESMALGPLASFGQDGRGELYLVDLDGPIYRIEPEP